MGLPEIDELRDGDSDYSDEETGVSSIRLEGGL